MIKFPELDVLDALKRTVEIARADSRWVTDWFAGLDGNRLNQVHEFIAAWNDPVIVPFYQMTDNSGPAITVVGGDGGSIDWYVGGYLGEDFDADGFETNSYIGERQRGSAIIEVAALNHDTASLLRGFVTAAMMQHRANFDQLGLNEMRLGYQRLSIDTESLARPIFRYVTNVEFNYMIEVVERYGPRPEEIGGITLTPVHPERHR